MRSLVLLALFAGFTFAAPVPKSLKKAQPSFVGVWKPVKTSEWYEFDAEGNMKVWSRDVNSPTLYTYAVNRQPDGPWWRMTWTDRGQEKPYFQVVFAVDGDELKLRYETMSEPPIQPGPETRYTHFTRDTSAK